MVTILNVDHSAELHSSRLVQFGVTLATSIAAMEKVDARSIEPMSITHLTYCCQADLSEPELGNKHKRQKSTMVWTIFRFSSTVKTDSIVILGMRFAFSK